MSWLKNAIHQVQKPKESIIGLLKKTLGGVRQGRSRQHIHASDITKVDFCPRQWALLDLQNVTHKSEFVPTALDVTYQMGSAAEKLLVEEWAGEHTVGNWCCRWCGEQRTMVGKPQGYCKTGRPHSWQYLQFVVEAPEYGIKGGIDGLFNVGSPRLLLAEVKTLNPTDFDKIIVPLPEHRIRTALYLKLIAESNSPYKDRINQHEARVLYISRAYGRMNEHWNEILPFKEYTVTRDDGMLKPMLQRAKALKLAREGQGMPSGICATAFDKIAQKCECRTPCFSGQFPAKIWWDKL